MKIQNKVIVNNILVRQFVFHHQIIKAIIRYVCAYSLFFLFNISGNYGKRSTYEGQHSIIKLKKFDFFF